MHVLFVKLTSYVKLLGENFDTFFCGWVNNEKSDIELYEIELTFKMPTDRDVVIQSPSVKHNVTVGSLHIDFT